ncbi:hypothetical protein Tco_0001164 [Tanacetum coccineum]
MGDENPIRTLGDYSKPSHEGYRNSIELPAGNNVVPLRSDTIRLVQNRCSFHRLGSEDPNQHLMDFLKLVDSLDLDNENRERTRLISIRSMDLFQGLTPKSPSSWHRPLAPKDLALYDNESWNDPRDFTKPVKEIALPQDVLSTSDRRLIELENQVQRLIEAHFALTQPTYVNKITTPCEICSGPDDTQYFMENTEQAFVEYASSRTDKAGDARLSKFEANFKQQQSKMTNKIDTVLKAITDRIAGTLPIDTVKNLKLGTHPIMRRKLNPREDSNGGISNFTGRIKGMHVFIENFTYIVDFMIIEDISSIIDPRLSQVVLGRPFVEISNMNHDPPEGVVRFINGTDEVSYKMPHKIEQYDSPSDLEKEHTKSVYLRNNKDKRRGVEYVMSKILGFYKECLELGLKYLRGMDDEGEVTILQVVLDLQHFKSSLFIFAATILQSSSAIHHISNIDNYVHQIIKFQSILITSSHSLWSSQSFGHQKGVCPWLTENHFNSQYMKHWASQSFGT